MSITSEISSDNLNSRSLLRAELLRIAGQLKEAEDRQWRAGALQDAGEVERAEWERLEAAGEAHAAAEALADLGLMLLRYTLEYRPLALTMYLADALRRELEPLADAIARLERRRE